VKTCRGHLRRRLRRQDRLATHFARQDIVELLLLHGTAPAQGPPATLPSDPVQDDGSNKENVSP
jgi:hypothetical protein